MKAEFAQLGIEVLTPTYPIADPEQTASAIEAEIHQAGLVKKRLRLGALWVRRWVAFGDSILLRNIECRW